MGNSSSKQLTPEQLLRALSSSVSSQGGQEGNPFHIAGIEYPEFETRATVGRNGYHRFQHQIVSKKIAFDLLEAVTENKHGNTDYNAPTSITGTEEYVYQLRYASPHGDEGEVMTFKDLDSAKEGGIGFIRSLINRGVSDEDMHLADAMMEGMVNNGWEFVTDYRKTHSGGSLKIESWLIALHSDAFTIGGEDDTEKQACFFQCFKIDRVAIESHGAIDWGD